MAGFNETINTERVRIAFFGRRNAGKSSLINALTGQQLSIVSDTPGTTTDPVSKSMEILPLGPCLVTDTAGLDDEGDLGELRIAKSLAVLDATDIAVLVLPANAPEEEADKLVRERCAKSNVPLVVVRTKTDLLNGVDVSSSEIAVSAKTGEGLEQFRNALSSLSVNDKPPALLRDLITKGDIVLCVCPIDASAPKGRLILPQQQVIRELIEFGAIALVCQPSEIAQLVAKVGCANIRFAVIDSQVFDLVDSILPKEIELTSFSILFARQKGDLNVLSQGAKAIDSLQDGDIVFVAEGCTHRRQCGDIGTDKIPQMLRKFTGKSLKFVFSSGMDFPVDIQSPPKLILHCGGCMLTRKMMLNRLLRCSDLHVPVVNYGVAIAYMSGIVTKPNSCMVKRR